MEYRKECKLSFCNAWRPTHINEHMCVLHRFSRAWLCDSMDCRLSGPLCPWNFPGKNTGWVAMPSREINICLYKYIFIYVYSLCSASLENLDKYSCIFRKLRANGLFLSQYIEAHWSIFLWAEISYKEIKRLIFKDKLLALPACRKMIRLKKVNSIIALNCCNGHIMSAYISRE